MLQVDALKVELAKLGPSPCDEPAPAVGTADAAVEEEKTQEPAGDAPPTADEAEKVSQLMAMFPDADAAVCLVALRQSHGSLEQALDWVLSAMG
jgi:hypothetical protein